MKVEILTGARKTAPNVRLVEPLKSEASTKAKTLGISLNALVSMAVRQYLDGEKPHQPAEQHDPVPHLVASSPGMRKALDDSRLAGAPRQAAASAVAGRGAPLPPRTTGKRHGCEPAKFFFTHHGSELISTGLPSEALALFLFCPHRTVPAGILGASYHHEYVMAGKHFETLWQRTRSQAEF
ncbi:hypothetical protein Xvtw_19885 [Xanthomonas campestris pv. vitiswoodrowii]|nr:hypothetical protein Xvtw_19885 [Xanthomonas campestris pv. vitiswoodrowii]